MMKDVKEWALEQAKQNGGLLSITPKATINGPEDLSIIYTPGVAAVSSAIVENKGLARELTMKKNTIAMVSDGSAVLGLGNIDTIPIFHDNQNATASVALAATFNSLKLIEKSRDEIKVVVNGGGAAGIAIARKFLAAGIHNILVVDKAGILNEHEGTLLLPHHLDIAKVTNCTFVSGMLQDALVDADIFYWCVTGKCFKSGMDSSHG